MPSGPWTAATFLCRRRRNHASDYINYKGWHSMILLALADHRYRFRFVNVGSLGRCHDAYVYQRSRLATAVEGPLFPFPLTPNLVKPFPHRGQLSEEQKTYNYHLSRSRRIVENAFGRMRARFRFVLKRMECDIDNASLAIHACCVLNNVCEHFGDGVLPQ
ncbi:hypothetical protein HPB48_023118 [Haemaphysalis longicornis]|uniref:DDE Tnp4 domain-containing protein n=1 Tax=Haemaphysalis longicornis TaxID=44386 RepID=A0A9J6H4T1_HAELO|nr:hypothetical protein HPB48_023118 [Haemaphysalis longicornis]